MAVGTNGPPVLDGAAYVYPQQTLAQLRKRIIARLGWAAQLANPPPGVNFLVGEFLRDANNQLWHRYSMLRQQRWFTISITAGNRHYDVPKTGSYIERRDIALTATSPGTITTTGGNFSTAGFTAGDRISVAGTDALDGHYTIAAGGVATGTLTLEEDISTAQAAGGMIQVTSDDFEALDPREITYAGLLDGTIWNELFGNIPPRMFNITQQTRPTNYEVRENIEFFPEPDKAYTAYLKGRIALKPFTADSHTTSVDPDVVYLQALANAKAHYGQRDAQAMYQQLEAFLGNLNSENFGTERLIPCKEPATVNLPLPRVTYSR